MISRETPLATRALTSAHARPARERAIKVVAALFLAAAFVLMGTPTAAAAPAFMDNSTSSSFAPTPCRGERPGFCPGPPTVQSNEQMTTDSDEQLTEDQLPEL